MGFCATEFSWIPKYPDATIWKFEAKFNQAHQRIAVSEAAMILISLAMYGNYYLLRVKDRIKILIIAIGGYLFEVS